MLAIRCHTQQCRKIAARSLYDLSAQTVRVGVALGLVGRIQCSRVVVAAILRCVQSVIPTAATKEEVIGEQTNKMIEFMKEKALNYGILLDGSLFNSWKKIIQRK